MAHPKVRADGLGETLLHVSCAVVTLVVVFIVAGYIGEAAVVATRYWSG